MKKTYSWHKEIYSKALFNIGRYCGGYLDKGFKLDGWYEYFKTQHPDEFLKYKTIGKKINELWDKSDGPSMAEFKKLIKSYEQAYKWAVDKYVAHLKAEAARDPQGALI